MDDKSRLLFTKDDWSIYAFSHALRRYTGHISAYAYHNGCMEMKDVQDYGKPVNCWHTGDLNQRCILCSVAVPDDIQTLVVLVSWRP